MSRSLWSNLCWAYLSVLSYCPCLHSTLAAFRTILKDEVRFLLHPDLTFRGFSIEDQSGQTVKEHPTKKWKKVKNLNWWEFSGTIIFDGLPCNDPPVNATSVFFWSLSRTSMYALPWPCFWPSLASAMLCLVSGQSLRPTLSTNPMKMLNSSFKHFYKNRIQVVHVYPQGVIVETTSFMCQYHVYIWVI